MSDYNQYITAINKIFDYLAKMKAGWNSQDNLNYIESIEEYKQLVVNSVNQFKNTPPKQEKLSESLEALGNDW